MELFFFNQKIFVLQDETFPELGVTGSVEGCDDQESVCSSNDREGDAFPKAFERELVTPTNLQKAHADSTESCGSTGKPSNNNENETANTDQTKDSKVEDGRCSDPFALTILF